MESRRTDDKNKVIARDEGNPPAADQSERDCLAANNTFCK